MAAIRPSDLPAAASANPAGALIIDDGSGVEKVTPLQVVDAATPLASQADAVAGANNTKRMTPLRVKQAIDGNPPTFVQAGTGAVSRTMQAKGRDMVSTKDFGAVADGASDDRPALQASINSLEALGGELRLPTGSHVATEGTNDACLTVGDGVSVEGTGLYSNIQPHAAVASDTAGLLYRPNGPAEAGFTRFENFSIGNITNGTRAGGVGLKFLTDQAGLVADRVLVEGVYVNPGTDVAFLHENDTPDNPTGGLFCSEFRRNAWRGGMKFLDSGDSLLLTTNTTTGAGIGVEFRATISAAGDGPSQVVFLNHNSTSELGAFLFHRARFPTVQNSNLEQTVANPGANFVSFLGDGKPALSTGIWMPSITHSLCGINTGAGLASIVYFGSVSGGVCWNNALIDGGGGATYDIVISADAHDVWIGPNLSYLDDIRISDPGTATRGTNRTPAKSNSWVEIGGTEPLRYTKSIDGLVTVWGVVGSGTTTAGTTVFTLPVGFRPLTDMRVLVAVDDSGSYVTPGTLLVGADGTVKITYVPTTGGAGNQKLHCSFSFRAAHANTIKIPSPFV